MRPFSRHSFTVQNLYDYFNLPIQNQEPTLVYFLTWLTIPWFTSRATTPILRMYEYVSGARWHPGDTFSLKPLLEVNQAIISLVVTVYSVQCSVYSVQCTVYSVQCTVFSVHCSVFRVQCSVFSVQCTVYSVQCTV